LLAKALSRNTPETQTDRSTLRTELEQVRRQGWATAPNQSIIGLNALAAPIFDALGTFVGAVAIVDSIQFIPEDPSAKQIRQTIEAGKKISQTIGYRGN
jgi:DNA-binding IclR family transcriptional regulator